MRLRRVRSCKKLLPERIKRVGDLTMRNISFGATKGSRKWNLPLTYGPKIPPVIDGECTQTIRTGNKKRVGDLIRFYVWEGRPYWSKRKTITRYAEIWMAEDILIIPTGFLFYHNGKFQKEIGWNSWEMRDIARRDYILPPTGEALRDVLMSKNKIPEGGVEAQILRWTP